MRNLVRFASVLFLFSSAILWGVNNNRNADKNGLDTIEQQFAGNYELGSFVSFPPEGGEVLNNYAGRITYDGHGHMSAIGVPARVIGSVDNANSGFSYFGNVSWDVENQTVTHHVTGSPINGAMVGVDMVRYYEWVDGLLVLATKDSAGRVVAKFSWRKFE
tara:strand:+ start:970 stop:1452 length:483 start_codon:yes stop_codon:yes gene_type:complete